MYVGRLTSEKQPSTHLLPEPAPFLPMKKLSTHQSCSEVLVKSLHTSLVRQQPWVKMGIRLGESSPEELLLALPGDLVLAVDVREGAAEVAADVCGPTRWPTV